MSSDESHLSEQDLLLAIDGELPPDAAGRAAAHLSHCWHCRARKQELEGTIVDFVRLHRESLDPLLPPAAGPRALLKARLAETAAQVSAPWFHRNAWRHAAVVAALAAVVAGAVALANLSHRPAPFHNVPVSFPEPSLTPGAVATVNRDQICSAAPPKNRLVPATMQRKVFEEYGIPSAQPQAYEVDYLITPALGGADDIRNLWPQSQFAAVWNAQVKDELEDRLRDLVCSGSLDLAAAQREISSDWIAAYKKYFHTERPR